MATAKTKIETVNLVNTKLANTTISTSQGKFTFNSEGVVKMPIVLAESLSEMEGFSVEKASEPTPVEPVPATDESKKSDDKPKKSDD